MWVINRELLHRVCSIAVVLIFLTGCNATHANVEDYLTYEGCKAPCWQGIEPGVTTLEELESALDQLGLEYEREDYGPHSLVTFFPPPSSLKPTSGSDRVKDLSTIIAQDELVAYIGISVDVCLSSIISSYGAPDTLFTNYNRPTYFYSKERLYLWTQKGFPTRVTEIGIYSEEYAQTEFKGQFPPLDQAYLEELDLESCTDAFTK